MSETTNYFATLASIDVSEHVEQKGQFSYLSWTWAIDQLRRRFPSATWEVKRFKNKDGVELPYLDTPGGAFVEVAVTVEGITLSQIHPVMDFKNKSVVNPSSTDVNKAIQRALVKAIALHGLGLYIYAGEDLPAVSSGPITTMQIDILDKKVTQFAAMRGRKSEEVYGALKITDVRHLTEDQANQLIDTVSAWIKKAEAEDQAKQPANA